MSQSASSVSSLLTPEQLKTFLAMAQSAQAAPQDDAGAPPSPADAPTASVAPAATPGSPDPTADYMAGIKKYLADYGPDALAKVQRQQRMDDLTSRVGGQLDSAASLIISGGPQHTQAPQYDRIKDYLQRMGLARENLGTQMQMMQMDPRGPLAQAKIRGMQLAGLPVAAGESPMVADALAGGVKAGGEAFKPGAESAAAQGSAASSFANAAARPQEIALKARELDQQMQMKTMELRQALAMKDAELAQQLGLELTKIQSDRALLSLKNPRQITPDEYYAGEGFPPEKLRDPEFVNRYLTVPKETIRKLDEAVGLQKQLEKEGPAARISSDTLSRLTAVYPQVVDAAARKMAGGQQPTQQVIEQAHRSIPEPSAWKDAAMLSRFLSAAAQVRGDLKADLEETRRGSSLKEGRSPFSAGELPPVGMIQMVGPDGNEYQVPATRLRELFQNPTKYGHWTVRP